MKRDSFAGAPLAAARKVVVAVVGATLLVIGLILMFLPGPGTVVLILAVSVLAAEFAWARRWLRTLKQTAADASRQLGLELGPSEEGNVPQDATDAAPPQRSHVRGADSDGGR